MGQWTQSEWKFKEQTFFSKNLLSMFSYTTNMISKSIRMIYDGKGREQGVGDKMGMMEGGRREVKKGAIPQLHHIRPNWLCLSHSPMTLDVIS